MLVQFLKKYNTTAEFEIVKPTLLDPWVVLTKDTEKVHYKDIDIYTIRFVDDDDSLISEQAYIKGAHIVKPINPTKEGYEFKRWNPEFNPIAEEDITYKAVYGTESLRFTAIEPSTLTITKTGSFADRILYKSSDNKITWESWNGDTISLNENETVYINGNNPNGLCESDSKYYKFVMTGKLSCEGDVMSLLGDNVTEIPCSYCFYNLFSDCVSLQTAPKITASVLKNNCYHNLFKGCTSLTIAPELPAMILANACYIGTFSGCKSLTTAPALPATTLVENCYRAMFYECSALVDPPVLHATTLVPYCYYGMFQFCTSLQTAPELPAEILTSNCYWRMFYKCNSLSYVKANFTTIGTSSVADWLSGTASVGTFVKNPDATWSKSSASIPSGWDVVDAS